MGIPWGRGLLVVFGAVALLGLSSCGDDSSVAVSSTGSGAWRAREVESVEVVDEDGRWVLRVSIGGDEICVDFEAGLGGGNSCSGGDGPFGLLGVQNGTIAPPGAYDDTESSIPEELLAASRDFAYAFGRVPEGVDAVRLTTSLGDVFVVDTLRPNDHGPGYFVVTIPAAKAPLQLDTTVEFGERGEQDGPMVWTDEMAYLATHVPDAPAGCVDRLAEAYNAIDLAQIDLTDGLDDQETEALATQVTEIQSAPDFSAGGACEQLGNAMSQGDRTALFQRLRPELAEVLSRYAEQVIDDLRSAPHS